ncbi:MAG: LamG domain-containing protein [Planctomycetes bacterium]|nr:LamG domain-containing protein [Planctomycetota bacterium]
MFRPLRAVLAAAVLPFPVVAQNTGAALTNGVDGYLEIPYSSQLVPQTGITLEAWITYDDSTIATGWRYPTIARQNITAQQEAYFLRVDAGQNQNRTLRFKVVTVGGGQVICDWPFAAGQLQQWTHVAATYDGQAANLYVDGVLAMTAAGTGQPIWDRGGVLRIGKGDDAGGPIEVWNGQLDEVRLWPFARSAAEIAQTKDYALSGVPGLVSTWNLDGHALDTSGGQHGSLTGTVNWPNGPTLTALPAASGTIVGAGTAGCGPLAITFGSLPQAGNLAFAPVCTGAPAGAPTFLALGFQTVATPLSIAGIDFWLNSSTSLLTLASTDAFSVSRFTVALPAWLTAGQQFAFQYGFVDPCGSQGVTASAALATLTQ